MNRKKRVLFFCKHNSCRSQMAEAYLRQTAGDRFEVYSAGLTPRMIHPFVETVMQEDGVSIRGQAAKSIDLYLGKQPFEHIVIVCREGEAECPQLYPFALHVERWPLSDPAEVKGDKEIILEAFRCTRNEIKRRIQTWITQVQ